NSGSDGVLSAAASIHELAARQSTVGRWARKRSTRMKQPKAVCLAVIFAVLVILPLPAPGGVSDTPLPTFSDGKAARWAAMIPEVVKDNGVETDVICTNLSTNTVDIGLEVFDQNGVRGNSIAAGNGAILNVAPGHTVTIATGATAVLHEDATITLE